MPGIHGTTGPQYVPGGLRQDGPEPSRLWLHAAEWGRPTDKVLLCVSGRAGHLAAARSCELEVAADENRRYKTIALLTRRYRTGRVLLKDRVATELGVVATEE